MIKILNRPISIKHKPFIIAEMSANHNQSLSNALKIIDKAKQAGVDAIKIQTYTPDTLTIKSSRKEFTITDKSSIWYNQNLYNLYKKAYTPWDWHQKIFDYSKKKGLICFSSPFDLSAVEVLKKLNCPAYKIASFEINNLPLIENVAKLNKPLIISTGLATFKEIKNAVMTANKNGCKKIILLKCTSTYPSDPKDSNIITINDLKKQFKCEVGISDHTKGIGVSVASIAYGSTVIEKHFTLDRKLGGVDSEFSLEPNEMKSLVDEATRAWSSLGKKKYGPTKSELNSLKFRKSIFVVKDIKKGEVFCDENIKIIRPNIGLEPKFYKRIIGKIAQKNLKKGTPLKKTHF